MARDGLSRKLAAIVVADIVGYTRLMEVDESETLNHLKAIRKELIEPKVSEYRGRIVKTTGDGMLAEFASVTDAVQSAVEVQEAMAERNASVPEDRRIQFRVGINLGEIIIEGDDIYGTGVNVAARLESIAEPGGICISGSVHEQIQSILSLGYEDLGEQTVKNISKPVRIFAVRPGRVEGASERSDAPVAMKAQTEAPSIAVLAFDNLSNDPEQEYFADGMVEEIITALSRLKWLFVIARNSSFTYKGRAVDVRQVATELGVRYVLEGSVRKAGRRVRITGQLIDATTGAHMWADRFDGDLEDIFDLQDHIAESVVGAIEPRLRKAEIERSKRKRPENLDAYDLYLRALPHAYAMLPDRNTEALALLTKAIALDPDFAPALAYAAWCHEQRLVRGWPTARESDVEDGVKLARAAIATDSEDANAIAAAGFVLIMLGRDYNGGLAAVQRALDLNPNTAIVSMFAGWANNFAGNPEDALACFERALRLSPSDPGAFFYITGAGMAHLLSGRYAEAAELATKSASIYAEWDTTFWVLAPAYGHLGRTDEGRDAVSKLLSLAPGATVSRFQEQLPFKDEKRLAIILDGLRKAGLPE